MPIELFVEPRKVYSWEEFKKEKPPFSIALDGFVSAPTQRDPYGPYANFDHHTGTDRFATRSTAGQAHLEIKMGLFDTFQKNRIPTANLFVNDPDEDTCLAVWLLKNFGKIENQNINELLYYEDLLDCTAGAYPFWAGGIRKKMAWIFEPYNQVRFEGKLPELYNDGMKKIIDDVCLRINDHAEGKSKEISIEGTYKKIGGGKNWIFTKENGPASRMKMYDDGITAYASLVSEKTDGSYVYVLGRKSVWIPFDIPRLYGLLNKEEGLVNEKNFWGGSDVIGGSPRLTGSRLNPQRLQEIINSVL